MVADSVQRPTTPGLPNSTTEQRWALKRKHAQISTDLELLCFEVAKARQKCALSPSTVQQELTAAEKHKLETNYANRLKEVTCKHCPGILKIVRQHKWAWPFNQPVDLQRFKDYLQLIEQPMDLGTIQSKLDAWQYSSPQYFERDMRLVFANCRRYNAIDQESKFDEKWSAIIPQKMVDIEVAGHSDEADIRQSHLLAAHARAQANLDKQWDILGPRFAALQASIAEMKAAAAKQCKLLRPDEQVALQRDLLALAPEQLDRGVEALVLARDESLERHLDGEFYDLHLAALDAPMQRGLQSYVEACLRPRSQCPVWPGLVVGSGVAGIPASGKVTEASGRLQPSAEASLLPPALFDAARTDMINSVGMPNRAPIRTSAGALWPPPKPPLAPQRSFSHVPAGGQGGSTPSPVPSPGSTAALLHLTPAACPPAAQPEAGSAQLAAPPAMMAPPGSGASQGMGTPTTSASAPAQLELVTDSGPAHPPPALEQPAMHHADPAPPPH